MIVFKYFYEKMDIFTPLITDWIAKLQEANYEDDEQAVQVIWKAKCQQARSMFIHVYIYM